MGLVSSVTLTSYKLDSIAAWVSLEAGFMLPPTDDRRALISFNLSRRPLVKLSSTLQSCLGENHE